VSKHPTSKSNKAHKSSKKTRVNGKNIVEPDQLYGLFPGDETGKIIEVPQVSLGTKITQYGIAGDVKGAQKEEINVPMFGEFSNSNPSKIEEDELFF
jgi:hypothetical protein